MCGIFAHISRVETGNHLVTNGANYEQFMFNVDKIKEYLAQRGPDASKEFETDLTDFWKGRFVGNILWTQGKQPLKQPLQDDEGNIFLWNGDVLKGPLETNCRCDSDVVFDWCKDSPLKAVTHISGPFAFVFWHAKSQSIWFGRDVLGRQSLLWSVSPNHLALSSVAHKDSDFTEVPALGVFMVNLATSQFEINFFPWAHLTTKWSILSNIVVNEMDRIVHYQLGDGSRRQSWIDQEPAKEEITDNVKGDFETFLCDKAISLRVTGFQEILTHAVERKVVKQPGVCKDCKQKCNHCSVAVLFSGGLDSTVLALLVDKFIPTDSPIDLLNVAFQQQNGQYDVPDRITGIASLVELSKLSPHRVWKFVEIDVSQEELAAERSMRLADLIHPLITVLDESLGCALWFAARGQGSVNGELYASPARVVVSGMGADEQLGGYMRHRRTLSHSGKWAALGRELAADVDSIGRRNLGRDDRVVSNCGRQLRMPFLDESVIAFIDALPPWHRCLPTATLPPGLGDKLLLRLLAWHLGLQGAATLPKRALQFGSRIANRKEKGNDVSHRL